MQSLIVITFNSNYEEVANNIGKQLLEDGHKLNNYKLNDISKTIIIHSLNNLHEDFTNAVNLMANDTKSVVIVKDSDLEIDKLIYKILTKNDYLSSVKYDYDKTAKKLSSRSATISSTDFAIVELLYSSGSTIRYINEILKDRGLSFSDFVGEVVNIKESQKVVRLSDDTKKMIAERDMSGITRKQISDELGINYKTIQRACKRFGTANKNSGTIDEKNILEKIDTKFEMKDSTLVCPKCQRKTNSIDENLLVGNAKRFYCKYCLEEYVVDGENFDTLKRVKWEVMD